MVQFMYFFLLPLYSGIEVWEGLHGVRSAINPGSPRFRLLEMIVPMCASQYTGRGLSLSIWLRAKYRSQTVHGIGNK